MNSAGLGITTPSDRELVMTRVFDAPRQLVFDAHTRPELLKRWLGVFGGWSLAICEIDLEVGGVCRYVWRSADGTDMGMRQVIREVVAPERIVVNEQFDEPWYEGEALETLTLEEHDGRTTLTITMLYASKDVRDSVLASPMKDGVAASYDKLAGLFESMRSRLTDAVAQP